MSPAARLVTLSPWALGLGLTLPIAAGLAGTIAPALRGQGFAALADWPGLPGAVALSLGTGLVSTLVALAVTLLLIGCLQGTAGFALLRHPFAVAVTADRLEMHGQVQVMHTEQDVAQYRP